MKKLLSSGRGMTLIEVLITIVLASIVSAIIYSLFITGLNLYQKVQVEGEMRDEADYIATLILNELTANQPRYVTPRPGNNGVTLHLTGSKTVNGPIIEDSSEDKKIHLYFQDGKFHIEKETPEDSLVLDLPGFTFEKTKDGSQTEISLDPDGFCTESSGVPACTHSSINVTIVVQDKKRPEGSLLSVKPLVLESSFGF